MFPFPGFPIGTTVFYVWSVTQFKPNAARALWKRQPLAGSGRTDVGGNAKTRFSAVSTPYGSVVANGDSPSGCLRSLFRNPRRVALDVCTPFGLQARPYGPPVGSVFAARLTVFGVRAFQRWNALERFKLKML